jgi:hypothetical protein
MLTQRGNRMDEDEAYAAWKRHRASRIAQNERVARRHNRRRERLEMDVAGVDIDELVPFVCECADVECVSAIEMTIAEYESVHETPDRFVVRPGHVAWEFERTIDRNDRYWTVSKPLLKESSGPGDAPFPSGWN